jgi:hypothetical protein
LDALFCGDFRSGESCDQISALAKLVAMYLASLADLYAYGNCFQVDDDGCYFELLGRAGSI